VLKNKNILIGVSASIAAYKVAMLVRLLVKQQANVKVVMTPSSKDFVTTTTLATLSKNPVFSEFIENTEGEWNNHVELGLWADFMLVAPATANTLAKMVHGICDNLLLACYLSARCPVYFAPAMDLDMHEHTSTLTNIAKLQERGNVLIPSGEGELASGLIGKGRMAEPEEIVEFLQKHILKGLDYYGKKILITAGPTYEAIDPVRFIGNRSSGKMGYALASNLAERGAEVILVAGPTNLSIDYPNVKVIKVESAQQMLDATTANFTNVDVAILAAAVADYTLENPSNQKIKKQNPNDGMHLDLVQTKDILKTLGATKTTQKLVGFALETQNGVENAKKKIAEKNLDFIVLNSLQDAGAGFGYDTNKVILLDANGTEINIELKPKAAIAKDIADYLLELF
jgi:phosphopantothenoylcysteine decarboxylase/phosphopantothenate--cysteine ligase